MEFYFKIAPFSAAIKVFQFPTGWNSTRYISVVSFPCRVSIPNGMEFYDIKIPPEDSEKSFNSQWDGILLNIKTKGKFLLMFQFPTGWNSTIKL